MPRLEKWSTRTIHPFSAEFYLLGYIFDDERFSEGNLIHTSLVVEMDWDEMIATTKSGTQYKLGERFTGTHYESEWFDG